MNRKTEFNAWLNEVLPSTSPSEVRAYHFNIFEMEDSFAVEVVGAPKYDPADKNWPCDEVWTCRPSEFLLPHPEVGSDWKPVEELVVKLVRGFMRDHSTRKGSILRKADAVGVGFVDGDIITVLPESGS